MKPLDAMSPIRSRRLHTCEERLPVNAEAWVPKSIFFKIIIFILKIQYYIIFRCTT